MSKHTTTIHIEKAKQTARVIIPKHIWKEECTLKDKDKVSWFTNGNLVLMVKGDELDALQAGMDLGLWKPYNKW